MFEVGEHVVCGSKGVCIVEKVTTLDIPGVEKERLYYILKPVYMAASTVYVPVDATKPEMRKILSKDEADELINSIPDIPLILCTNEKLLEQEYKSCMKTINCEEWIKVIKTIYKRNQKRIEAGRKVTALDSRFFKIAEDCLYGELAVSLDIPKDHVQEFITGKMEEIGA